MGAEVLCFWCTLLWRCEHQSKDYISKVERLFNAHKKNVKVQEGKVNSYTGTPFECKVDLQRPFNPSIQPTNQPSTPPTPSQNIENCMFSSTWSLKLSCHVFRVSHIWITNPSIINKKYSNNNNTNKNITEKQRWANECWHMSVKMEPPLWEVRGNRKSGSPYLDVC